MALAFSTLAQAGDFSVNLAGKTSSSDLIKAGKSWRSDLPSRLRVTLRSSKAVSGSEVVFKAYFYDADANLIRTQNGPNPIWTQTKRGIEEVGLPAEFKPGQMETVYLALPEDLSKMRTCIVIFGQGEDLSYDISPNSKKVADFHFPEQDKLK